MECFAAVAFSLSAFKVMWNLFIFAEHAIYFPFKILTYASLTSSLVGSDSFLHKDDSPSGPARNLLVSLPRELNLIFILEHNFSMQEKADFGAGLEKIRKVLAELKSNNS